jgi:hypothetical protein
MKHYVLETYHGPLVITQRRFDWIISSPYRPPEVFDGIIPANCLINARQVSTGEATRLLGDCSLPLWCRPGIEHPDEQVIAC